MKIGYKSLPVYIRMKSFLSISLVRIQFINYIAHPIENKMIEPRYQERRKKTFKIMRLIYDVGMGALILGMSAVMFFGDRWEIPQVAESDASFRYLFGGICLLYGGFRVYRGFNQPQS